MRKLISVLLCLMLLSICVFPAAAESFSPANTDFTLDIDTEYWYAFTPENLEGNPELEELGLTYEYMNNFFTTNNIYLDALLVFTDTGDYLEFYVRKTPNDDVVNLAPCTTKELKDFEEAIKKEADITRSEILENEYNYVIFERYDTATQQYGLVYTTVVNGDIYAFTFLKNTPIDDKDEMFAKEIMDTVTFDVEDPDRKFFESGDSDFFDSVGGSALKGGLVGAGVGLFGGLIRKAIKKKKAKSEE